MMKLTKSVGLIVIIASPNSDQGEAKIILQQRPSHNAETNQPESYPGGFQVTCHGRIKVNENIIEALIREAGEELGPEFAQLVAKQKNSLIKIYQKTKGDEIVTTYALTVADESIVKKIKPTKNIAGIKLFPLKDVEKIENLKKYSKQSGIEDKETIAMFEDEIKALKKISKKYSEDVN